MVLEPANDQGDSPLVSVIVVFLNGEKYLQEAVESVFSQSYGNWELLLVDDGSTDTSTRLAQDFASGHPGRVHYFAHDGHQNCGPSASRNLGVRHSRGEFIAFLDCDDVWLPQKLERQVTILVANPDAGMVAGSPVYWHSWTGNSQPDTVPELGVPEDTLYHPPELLSMLYPLGGGASPCPSDLLIRRRVFGTAGGFQEEFRGVYRLYEDPAFLVRVYLKEGVFLSGECWTRYRIHPESCVATVLADGKYHAVRLFFLNYLERYLTQEGVEDVRVWGMLRKALRQYGRPLAKDNFQDTRELKWQLRVAKGNQARLEFPAGGGDLVRVSISRAGTKDAWDIQLNQPNLAVQEGNAYTILFLARTDQPRAINIAFSMAHEPWGGLGLYQTIETTAEWQGYSLEFTATANDGNGRLHFDLGGNDSSFELGALAMHSISDGKAVEPDVVVIGDYPVSRWEDGPEGGVAESRQAPVGAPLKFSVVIPTYQRRDLVVRTVKAFAHQEFQGSFEVIVVVDGSRDGTARALRQLTVPFPLTVLEQTNHGLSVTRNRGAAASRGEILLFLDDDMEPHPRLLAEHERSRTEGADVVLGHFPLHPQSPRNFLAAGIRQWAEDRGRRLSQPGADLTIYELMFGQTSISREVFQTAGGFDTDFTRGGSFGGEDLDLGHRLMSAGYQFVFNPFALSYQSYVVQPRKYLRNIRQSGQADVVFAGKHPGETAAIFSAHAKGRLLPAGFWRAVAAWWPLTSPLTAALRFLALALVERGIESSAAVRFYFEICEMEYWRGVHQAGGKPRLDAVRVLAYHAIQDLSGGNVMEPYGVTREQFRSHMKVLQRLGFHFIGADQFLEFLHRGGKLPSRPVLLTFDDCYDDLLRDGLPVLKQLGIPAIAFAVSGFLGESNLWDKGRAPMLRLLDSKELQVLSANCVEIGAHSRTHRAFPKLSPAEILEEANGSVEDLEAAGLPRPRTFAYPFGAWNHAVRRVLRSAGLEAAFTTEPGLARQGLDPFLVPRIEILRQDTGWRFLWKVIRPA
jgi:glycosyltransferase involved in cell wall biosynthesis/peptidoglycan/xylan/chitin deacetylase (PgdA/CDA1 family)